MRVLFLPCFQEKASCLQCASGYQSLHILIVYLQGSIKELQGFHILPALEHVNSLYHTANVRKQEIIVLLYANKIMPFVCHLGIQGSITARTRTQYNLLVRWMLQLLQYRNPLAMTELQTCILWSFFLTSPAVEENQLQKRLQ